MTGEEAHRHIAETNPHLRSKLTTQRSHEQEGVEFAHECLIFERCHRRTRTCAPGRDGLDAMSL